MSLTALAIRLATIRALKARTFAEDRVFDSKINPLALLSAPDGPTAQPIMVVSTDDDNSTVGGRDLMAADHRLELVIEIIVAAKVSVKVEDGGDEEILSIAASDAGLEATLGLMGWQIARTLSGDGGEWGDLWRSMVTSVATVACRRGADDENGVRYAARQYVYTIDHVADPLPGMLLDGTPWARAMDLMKADPDPAIASLARIIETQIADDGSLTWEKVRGQLGLAADEAELIGEYRLGMDTEVPLADIDIGPGMMSIAEPEA